MYTDSNLKERCQKILEENGGNIADQASRILLEDPTLKALQSPLEFISKNWREPLTPAMIRLACEAVGGKPEVIHEASLAMSLIHLSFYVWDDMVDKARSKSFKPTLFGKFGEGASLIIGGLASAKAFSILNQMPVDKMKRQTVVKLVWDLWANMAKAETINLELRNQRYVSSRKKFLVIKMEAVDLETCLKIGAVLGNGSKEAVKHLARYGLHLGIILELWKDFHVSVNWTLELDEKIRKGALPYSLLWASEHSEKLCKRLTDLAKSGSITPSGIKDVVKLTLATRVLNETEKKIKKLANNAMEELSQLKMNITPTQTLKLFVEAQPQLFIESLSTLQDM